MYQKLPYYMAYPIQTEYDEKAERTGCCNRASECDSERNGKKTGI